jgi:hypothetical protein
MLCSLFKRGKWQLGSSGGEGGENPPLYEVEMKNAP